jgi:hypothetical protein
MTARREFEDFIFGHGWAPGKNERDATTCAAIMEACIIFSLEALEALGKRG